MAEMCVSQGGEGSEFSGQTQLRIQPAVAAVGKPVAVATAIPIKPLRTVVVGILLFILRVSKTSLVTGSIPDCRGGCWLGGLVVS